MTTHRRAWMLRAGVVAVLAAGALAGGPAGPALAVDPNVQITSLPTANLGPGQRVNMKFRVTNNNDPQGQPANDSFNITLTMPFAELDCDGQCNFTDTIDPGQSKEFTATLIAGTLGANQTKSGNVRIEAKSGSDEGSATRQITVRGPAQTEPENVKEVSGKVIDTATGAGLEDAVVGIQDSRGHVYMTNTDADGRFRFVSSSTKPIAAGVILITAQKEDYKVNPKRLSGNAGQALTTTLAMTSTKPAEPTATPAITEEALPSGEPTLTDGASPDAANLANEDSDSGGGTFSWVLIVLGGLLVSLGVGAIVLLLVRRKEDDGDEEGDDMPARPRGPVPTPASRGMYRGAPGADPTRVVGHPGMGAAPTMVARPQMADAPTMMHRPDPYADPYAAPLPPPQPAAPQPSAYGATQPGWGGPGQPTATQPPYGSPAGAGYGSPAAPGGAYGAPTSPGTYGSPAAPTGGYGTPPGGGYGGAPQSGAHGAPPTSGDGYGNQAGRPGGESYGGRDYAAPASSGYGGGRDYAAPSEQGYGAAGGYPGGYDSPAGSPASGGSPSGGYDDGGAGYSSSGRPYESGGYRQPAGGGYPPPSGGYDDGGYGDQREGYAQNGYEQGGGGYDARPGYDRVPEQRRGFDQGGYDQGGYDQGGSYDESGGSHSRHSAGQQPSRSERRSLDWLDD